MVVKEYSLKVDTKTAQSNVDELNSSFESQTQLIDELENELFDYESQLKKTSKTNLAARESLNKKISKTKDALRLEKKGLKDVTKERKKANESLKEAEENAADYSGVLGVIDSKTGGLISGFSGMTKSIGGATKGFNLMKVAIIGTGIGALLIALTSLSAAFTSSEAGQNKWNKIMGIIGSTVSVFTDRLASLGDGLINLFTNPIETLKNFGKSIKEFVMDKIDKTIESLGFMGSAISKLFKGDFSGALGDAEKGIVGLNKALNPAVIITNALIESTKELTKEILEEGKAAAKIADQRAKADKLDRQIILDRAKANRDRAELLGKSVDKEKFSLQERIEFLTKAGELEEEITAKEIAAAKLRLEAKTAENELSNSTKEDLDEEVQLKAKLMELETAKLMKAREVTGQVIALKAEEAAKLKAIEDEEKLKKEEAQKIQDEKDAERKKKLDEAEKERLIKVKERAKQEAEIEKALVQQKKEIQAANLNNVASGFALLGQLAGKNKGLQAAAIIGESAAGVARTIIQTQTSNAATVAQGAALAIPTGGASVVAAAKLVTANKISAGISIASNIAATAKALGSLKAGGSPPSVGGGALSSSTGAPVSIPSVPPTFNTVGSSETNQLAEAIGVQEKKPVQAYVVSSDISTAQELDRNIIKGATIG
jgi:hypothetical protein